MPRHTHRQSCFWFARAIPKRSRTGMTWLNPASVSLRQIQRPRAVPVGITWLLGLMPTRNSPATRESRKTSSRRCSKTSRCWTRVRVAPPPPLLSAARAIFCSPGKTKPCLRSKNQVRINWKSSRRRSPSSPSHRSPSSIAWSTRRALARSRRPISNTCTQPRARK